MKHLFLVAGAALWLMPTCLLQPPESSPESSREPESEEAEVEQSSPLQELAWMVGTWVDEGEESRVVTECSWTKNGKFLKRSFSVVIDNEVTLEGDQIVGWDPLEGRIRCWTFDSEGGIGEGRWEQDGSSWLIKTSFTLGTGEKASATNVITYVDEDTATWQSIGREVAGELLPSIPEVTVIRQPEAQTESETPAEESTR
jgi:hypothetical protein